MANLKQLEKDAIRLAKEIRKQASANAVAKAIAMAEALADATPVDSTRAVSNWRVSAGFPKTSEIDPYFAGKGGSTAGPSIAAVKDAARAALSKKKVGQYIFISNNTDYIEELNKGTSPQQPNPGWIEFVAGLASENYKEFNPLVL